MCITKFNKKKISEKYSKYNQYGHYSKRFILNKFGKKLPLMPIDELIWHQIDNRFFQWKSVDGQLGIMTNIKSAKYYADLLDRETAKAQKIKSLLDQYKEDPNNITLKALYDYLDYVVEDMSMVTKDDIDYLLTYMHQQYTNHLYTVKYSQKISKFQNENKFIPISNTIATGRVELKYKVSYELDRFMKDIGYVKPDFVDTDKFNSLIHDSLSLIHNVSFREVEEGEKPDFVIKPYMNPIQGQAQGMAGRADIFQLFEGQPAIYYINHRTINAYDISSFIHEIGHILGLQHPFTVMPEYFQKKLELDQNYKSLIEESEVYFSNVDRFETNMGYSFFSRGHSCGLRPITQAVLDEMYGAVDPFPASSGSVKIFYDPYRYVNNSEDIHKTVTNNGDTHYIMAMHHSAGRTIHNPSAGEKTILDFTKMGPYLFEAVFAPNGYFTSPLHNKRQFSFSYETKIDEVYYPIPKFGWHNIIIDGFDNMTHHITEGGYIFKVKSAGNKFLFSPKAEKYFYHDYLFEKLGSIIMTSPDEKAQFVYQHFDNKTDLMCLMKLGKEGEVKLRLKDYFLDLKGNYQLQCKSEKTGMLNMVNLPKSVKGLSEFVYTK